MDLYTVRTANPLEQLEGIVSKIKQPFVPTWRDKLADMLGYTPPNEEIMREKAAARLRLINYVNNSFNQPFFQELDASKREGIRSLLKEHE